MADALYLRRNITHGGGAHIVNKYSGKASDKGTGSKTSKSRTGKQLQLPETNKSLSPGRSASRFLQEQGGIDAIIQEAAKGVYSRGEKWGVNRALRGAVEGLQSGANFPRRQLDGSRWSLDEGSNVPSDSNRIGEIKNLEQRSKGLAKLLENAIGELWEQQRQCSKEKDETFANALSLAIAKVQFVQVYLENPTMPFTIENPGPGPAPAPAHDEEPGMVATKDMPTAAPQADSLKSPNLRQNVKKFVSLEPGTVHPNIDQVSKESSGASTSPAPEIKASKSRPQPLPFHHPRPSLAQSSFSWMLGEDQRKSSFVSPSPFPSEKRAAKEKADFLFGEGKTDMEGKSQKGKATEEDEEEEVIDLGTLRGANDGGT